MLLRLCTQRTVWLQAARRMCRNHGLFLPSFPFETMSVQELTRLALSPFNFSRLVSTTSEGRLPEIQSRSFRLRLDRFHELSRPLSLHMLPGGRYLFTYHAESICLWDLGYGRDLSKPYSIACLHRPGLRDYQGDRPPCPIEDGNGVRLTVVTRCVSSDWGTGTFQLTLAIY